MTDPAIASALNAVLSRQKAAQLRDGTPSAALRAERLTRCISLLVDYRKP
ncbi:MAG: coniferyl aldehyde dehydrogenase, partial [Alphaproteobacteria bacterium]|nr:coniferyl aldehyde dehydrogenase [Alphaproteobacteria bacterium]